MKITVCDVCGKNCSGSYDYTVSVGNFHTKGEIGVHVRFSRGGCPGITRWTEVDLCSKCKEEALRLALIELDKGVNKKKPMEHNFQARWES